MDTFDSDQLLTVEEAAALLQVKTGTLYAWASRGKVPYRKVGVLLRFHRGELLEWTRCKAEQAGEVKPPRRANLRMV